MGAAMRDYICSASMAFNQAVFSSEPDQSMQGFDRGLSGPYHSMQGFIRGLAGPYQRFLSKPDQSMQRLD